MSHIYDISPLISAKTAVFPGDTAFERTVALDCGRGDAFTLSSIRGTVHLGAHVDAPSHYDAQGVGIDARDLGLYYGDCQVMSVRLPRGERVLTRHLPSRVSAPRVLFHTGSFPNPDVWNGDFNSLSPELVSALADQGVKLVGIDTPSIDPAEDKELRTHREVFRRDLAVLEGVILDGVPDGIYTLIALPLKLKDADASPVRAVLVAR